MKRMRFFASHPLKSLGVLATLLVAVGLTVGSGAFFQATEASESNSAGAATLDLDVYGSNDPVAETCFVAGDADCSDSGVKSEPNGANSTTFKISNLVPGGPTVTRQVQVENKSSVPVRLFLKSNTTGSKALLAATQTPIGVEGPVDADPNTPYNYGNVFFARVPQNFSTFEAPGDPIDADQFNVGGTYAPILLQPNQRYKYVIEVKMPASGENQNNLQGKSFQTTLTFIARNVGGGAPSAGV